MSSNLQRVASRPVIPALVAVSRRLPDAVFSGSTAGWLHGLDLPPVDPVQVTVPNAHISNRAGVILRRARLDQTKSSDSPAFRPPRPSAPQSTWAVTEC